MFFPGRSCSSCTSWQAVRLCAGGVHGVLLAVQLLLSFVGAQGTHSS